MWLSNDTASWASILDWSRSASWCWLLSSSKLTSQETSIVVRLVEWVYEWVQSFASGAWWDKGTIENSWNFWGEFSSVLVESKVTVGRVMGVDEWVTSWLFFNNIVIGNELWFRGRESLWLRCWSSLLLRCWSWGWSSSWSRLLRLRNWLLARLGWFWGWSGYKSGGILSTGWNVSSF